MIFSLDLFINLQLHPQRLQKLLGVGQLLHLQLRLTLQPASTPKDLHLPAKGEEREWIKQLKYVSAAVVVFV